MTEYRNIYVKKRSFVVLTEVKHSPDSYVVVRASDTLIARNGDTIIARNGDTIVTRGSVRANLREIGVAKRRFVVLVKKLNGS